MAAMFGYISGSPFVLQEIFGLSPQWFSVCFAANGVGIVVASQVTGALAGKLNNNRIFVTGLSTAAAGGVALFASLLFGLGLPLVLPSLFVLVSSVGIVSTVGLSLALQNHPRVAGSAAGLVGVAQLFLGAIASPLAGLGGQSSGGLSMGIVIAVADVGALVWYSVTAVRNRRLVSPST